MLISQCFVVKILFESIFLTLIGGLSNKVCTTIGWYQVITNLFIYLNLIKQRSTLIIFR